MFYENDRYNIAEALLFFNRDIKISCRGFIRSKAQAALSPDSSILAHSSSKPGEGIDHSGQGMGVLAQPIPL